MILVSQWYTPEDPVRRSELSWCREFNDGNFEKCDYLEGWHTFGDLVRHCDREYPHTPCVIANADVTIHGNMFQWIRVGRLVALTPWDNPHHPRFMGHSYGDKIYSGAQDAWAFIAGTLPEVNVEIPMGHVGCDQLIVGWAVRQGLGVVNPCFDVRVTHHHKTPSESRSRRPLFGYFGYPELGAGGSVMAHEWSEDDSKRCYNWEYHPCRKSR